MRFKYQLIDANSMVVKTPHGEKKVSQVRALIDFGSVSVGTYGGFIESESNMSQEDDSWVEQDQVLYGEMVAKAVPRRNPEGYIEHSVPVPASEPQTASRKSSNSNRLLVDGVEIVLTAEQIESLNKNKTYKQGDILVKYVEKTDSVIIFTAEKDGKIKSRNLRKAVGNEENILYQFRQKPESL